MTDDTPPVAGQSFYPVEIPPGPAFSLTANTAPYNGQGGVLFHILPYVEQNNMYQTSLIQTDQATTIAGTNTGKPVYSLYANSFWANSRTFYVPLYLCPTDPTTSGNISFSPTCYGGNEAVFRIQTALQKYPSSISDGTSNTIFFSEKIYDRADVYNQLRTGDSNGKFNESTRRTSPRVRLLSPV